MGVCEELLSDVDDMTAAVVVVLAVATAGGVCGGLLLTVSSVYRCNQAFLWALVCLVAGWGETEGWGIGTAGGGLGALMVSLSLSTLPLVTLATDEVITPLSGNEHVDDTDASPGVVEGAGCGMEADDDDDDVVRHADDRDWGVCCTGGVTVAVVVSAGSAAVVIVLVVVMVLPLGAELANPPLPPLPPLADFCCDSWKNALATAFSTNERKLLMKAEFVVDDDVVDLGDVRGD